MKVITPLRRTKSGGDCSNESFCTAAAADWEISENLIGKEREIVYRGPPEFAKLPTLSTSSRDYHPSSLFTHSNSSAGKSTGSNSTPSDNSSKKPILSTPSDESRKKHSDHLALLGVDMPPGMVLQKSSRWIIPFLTGPLMGERESIVAEREYINRNVFIVLLMIPVWLPVIMGLSIWKPYYASLGIVFWLAIIHYLGSVIYLSYLRMKDQVLEKFLAELTEIVLKYRVRLPMVKVDDVKADQPGTDLINMYCYLATYPLFSNLDACLNLAVVTGLFGLVFCGEFYLSAHSKLIFVVAVAVIVCTICFGRVAGSFVKRTISLV